MKIKYLLMAAFVLPCAMVMSCGDDGGSENVDAPSTPKTNDTEVEKYIDASYSPSLSEIQNTWTGEYEGWDNNQEKNTKIKRMVVLAPNNTYTNTIQGV